MANITSVEDRYKKYKGLYEGQKNNAITTVNNVAKAESDTVSQIYGSEIDTAKKDYEDLYRQNAVQKYVNKKQIAETMANNGLTVSGLNRTQQTANQLSYANSKNKIDIKLNDTVESIRNIMNSKLTDIENTRAGKVADIEQSYDDAAMSAAQNEYKTEYDAEVERQKAENDLALAMYKANLSASTKNTKTVSTNNTPNLYTFLGSDEEDNFRFKDSKGKTVTVKKGINPYTGTNNSNSSAVKKYGTFSNGYQPKGIVTDSYSSKLTDSGVPKQDVFGTGRKQTIWQDDRGYYWVWNGAENTYVNVSQ